MRRTGFLVLALGLAAAPGLRGDTLNVAADAFTHSRLPNTNFGAQTSMGVRIAANGAVVDSYARFDLSALPPAPVVERAVLRLWLNAVRDLGSSRQDRTQKRRHRARHQRHQDHGLGSDAKYHSRSSQQAD